MKRITFVLLTLTIAVLATFVATTAAQDTATDESQAVREKVKQKVELARKAPKAYVGTMTDKTSDTLQIKTEGSEIQQISIDETTNFVKLGKVVSKVTVSDLAIGDFIVAMGFKDVSGVLSAKRVLLTSPPQPLKRFILLGEVTSTKKGELSLKTKADGLEYKVSPAKTCLVTLIADGKLAKLKFADISEKDEIIVVGVTEGDTLSARRIQIIFQAPSPSPTPKPSPKPTKP